MSTYKTLVIMDNGREYKFEEEPEHFIQKLFNDEVDNFVRGKGFILAIDHIACIEAIDEKA